MSNLIFKKEYGGEDINDLERDVSEALDSRYNPSAERITQDEHGFVEGKLVVTITWVPDEEEGE
ncbi:MAG: hypothetical protein RR740_00585 [Pseudomonas sp.]